PWLVLVPAGLAASASGRAQAHTVRTLPNEMREAGLCLRRLAAPGDRVIARKPHVGFVAGLEGLAFPFTDTWAELGEFARKEHARWLYFSYAEAGTRIKYAVLLDTTADVPGLTIRWAPRKVPAVLYEIGPEFGAEPAW